MDKKITLKFYFFRIQNNKVKFTCTYWDVAEGHCVVELVIVRAGAIFVCFRIVVHFEIFLAPTESFLLLGWTGRFCISAFLSVFHRTPLPVKFVWSLRFCKVKAFREDCAPIGKHDVTSTVIGLINSRESSREWRLNDVITCKTKNKVLDPRTNFCTDKNLRLHGTGGTWRIFERLRPRLHGSEQIIKVAEHSFQEPMPNSR